MEPALLDLAGSSTFLFFTPYYAWLTALPVTDGNWPSFAPHHCLFLCFKHSLLRKAVAIILLSLQLLTGTELCQLFKVPVLFEHYSEHRGGNEQLSFFSFLREHYLNGNKQDPDYLRDMQLPFKTNTGALIVSHSISIPVPGITLIPSAPDTESKQQYPFVQYTWLPSSPINSIFQPPRIS